MNVRVLAPDIFVGRSAVVTGGGSGIGRAIALRLAELGCDVTIIGRRREGLEQTRSLASGSAGHMRVEPADVRDHEGIARLIRQIGDRDGIDILVNNAGGQFAAPTTEISMNGWKSVIDLNLNSVFAVTRAAYPHLAAERGAVINMSLSLVERGIVGVAHSIAARAGVLGLTRTLALEWAEVGIRLNCIGPGRVFTEALTSNYPSDVQEAMLSEENPMRRATTVEEVAELTAFLASPAAALMTGQLIQIDGAAHLGSATRLIPR